MYTTFPLVRNMETVACVVCLFSQLLFKSDLVGRSADGSRHRRLDTREVDPGQPAYRGIRILRQAEGILPRGNGRRRFTEQNQNAF